MRTAREWIVRLRANREGAIALTFALLAPLLLLFVVGTLDVASMNTAKTNLQQSTDAAALAVSGATSRNPNTPETTLKTLAQNMLAANFGAYGAVTITDFHVCAPIQNDCTTGSGVTMAENTVALTTQANAPCYVPAVLPGVCTSAGVSAPMTVSNVSTIGIPSNIQINLLMDTSGSMIVGSTPSDVTTIENWTNVAANWAKVHNTSEKSQSQPCAFACHDEGPSSSGVNGATTSGFAGSDMQAGLTNAHAAGATTRFDVMVTAASNLITHVQNEITGNAQLAKNSYYFNISTMADALTSIYTAKTANDWTDPQNAINNNIFVGLDSHFSSVLKTFATAVGANGTGATSAAPLKFVIIVTDGLQSDFYSDFYGCSSAAYDSAWAAQASQSPGWNKYYALGCYSTPMPTDQCTAMKNNGVVVAVLETPYVPLTGQDPGENDLYETYVRHTIYPTGPNSSSTVSAALQSCASSGYYYQASSADPTTISSGFVTLTDKFLASTAYIRQ